MKICKCFFVLFFKKAIVLPKVPTKKKGISTVSIVITSHQTDVIMKRKVLSSISVHFLSKGTGRMISTNI